MKDVNEWGSMCGIRIDDLDCDENRLMYPVPNPGEWIEIFSVTRALIKSLYILFACCVDTLYVPYNMVDMDHLSQLW